MASEISEDDETEDDDADDDDDDTHTKEEELALRSLRLHRKTGAATTKLSTWKPNSLHAMASDAPTFVH